MERPSSVGRVGFLLAEFDVQGELDATLADISPTGQVPAGGLRHRLRTNGCQTAWNAIPVPFDALQFE